MLKVLSFEGSYQLGQCWQRSHELLKSADQLVAFDRAIGARGHW